MKTEDCFYVGGVMNSHKNMLVSTSSMVDKIGIVSEECFSQTDSPKSVYNLPRTNVPPLSSGVSPVWTSISGVYTM